MAWSLPELRCVFAVGVQHCMNSPFYGSVGQTIISISWFSIRTLFPLNPIVQSCSHSAKNQDRDTSMLGYCLLLQCSACPLYSHYTGCPLCQECQESSGILGIQGECHEFVRNFSTVLGLSGKFKEFQDPFLFPLLK